MSKVLRLNAGGLPVDWISHEDAAGIYCKQQVLWEIGDKTLQMRGGINMHGEQSILDMAPVIATIGNGKVKSVNSFNNYMLFRRDQHRCLYCGHQFDHSQLTRDHVHPKGQGGNNTWNNVVAACRGCNHAKGNRTPEQAGMPLLAVPFTPNLFESMFLAQRRILGDQMEYLGKQFSNRRQWTAAA